jgi:methanogenic corrinoid protein MtbC1
MTNQSLNVEEKTIPKKRREQLIKSIADLKEKESITALKKLHGDGFDPIALFKCCMEGVRKVGLRFEQGRYFLSALIMAGEIMRQSSEFLNPYLTGSKTGDTIGSVLIGTIEGDIHDLGKNILKDLLQCHGFEVTDLGVDVPIQTFADKAMAIKPDFVAISCLLTTCLPFLKKAIEQLHQPPPSRDYITIIGGGCVDQHINDWIKADHWFPDAIMGSNFCKQVALDKLTKSK